jgi:Amt family ammonium transporter
MQPLWYDGPTARDSTTTNNILAGKALVVSMNRSLLIRLTLTLAVVAGVILYGGSSWALAQYLTAALVNTPASVLWVLIATSMALLVPVGLVLIGVAGLERERAWEIALGVLVACALAAVAYWAVGFALHFGGIGLVYVRPELSALVWEWSPLPANWGTGWGAAGLSGWFLADSELTATAYALFFSQMPWLFVVTLLPVMVLLDRASALAPWLLALLLGGVIYPLAGNWVQGGGWLAALGRNLNLGHGFVDPGGTGVVFLLAAVVGGVALVVWAPRRPLAEEEARLPADRRPLRTVVGSLLLLVAVPGWLWANPLQLEALGPLGVMRGSVNGILSAVAGGIFPLFYTWFVTGQSNPVLVGRGVVAGTVAGLALAPFVPTLPAFLAGLLAGTMLPLLTYVVDLRARLNDTTGLVASVGVPALLGLLGVGVAADGRVGIGWQMAGNEGVWGGTGQGVSGLWVATGFLSDWLGQLQAQVIGVTALLLWGGAAALFSCVPLAWIAWSVQRSAAQLAAVGAAEEHSQPGPPFETVPTERRRIFPPVSNDL